MKTTFIVSAILGLLGGIVCGYYSAVDASQAMESAAAISVSQVTSNFSVQQFKHADPDHARNAVLEEIQILQLLEKATHGRYHSAELWVAYTRLAMIEESSNHLDAARSAIAQAKLWLKMDHPGREPTEDQMKQGVRGMDDALDRF